MKASHPISRHGATVFSLLLPILGSLTAAATDTNIIAWPANYLTNVPNLPTNAIAVTGGDSHCIALLADRTVQMWGSLGYGGSNAPPPDATNIVGIAAGSGHGLAVRSDGTVALWGAIIGNGSRQVPPEVTNVVAVGVGPGAQHALALRADGTVVDWGLSTTTNIPSEAFNIVSVAAGSRYSLALRSDGRVIAWGERGNFSATNVPASATNIVAIATTWDGNIALRADGKLLTWGSPPSIPSQTTLTNIVEVAGMGDFSAGGMALNRNGKVFASSVVPATATNIMTIGGAHNTFMAVKAVGAPLFPLPSVRRTVAAGQTAYFRLHAVGALPLSYQWSFQGTNLSGATNPVLAVSGVQQINAGPYVLTVTNALGVATSSAMMLSVEPLEVTIKPKEQTVFVGSNATFTAVTVGQGPFTYQWKMNGTNLGGATQSSLSLTNVHMEVAGMYSVAVSNTFGTVTSVDAKLVVLPLFVTVQPQSQTITRWTPATLSITAGGVPPLRYQWKLNGTNLPGATDSVLTIPSMQAPDAGTYAVAVTNDYTGLISSNALVRMTSVAAWGDNGCGQANVPVGLTNVVGIAAGSYDGMALRADGTIVVWGCNDSGQTNVPPGATNVVAIVGGYRSSSALRADGTALGWGLNTSGENDVPPSFINGVQIAGVISHRLGLRADGTAVGWGYNAYGVADVPADLTNLVGVAAGYNHSAVLRADGTVIAWGLNVESQTNAPPDLTNAVAIAGGNNHTLALRADGSVSAWGYNAAGQTNVPWGLTNVVAIAGGWDHSLALKADGTVIAWGDNSSGQTNIPPGLQNVVAIAAGAAFNLALVGDGPPVLGGLPVNPVWSGNAFSVSLISQNNRVYRLESKDRLSDNNWIGLPLVAGTGGTLTLTDPAATGSQRFYRVRQW